jgi:hypothetical protein
MGLARFEDDGFSFTGILGLLTKNLIGESALLHRERFLL